MADVKISQLPAASTPLAGTEVLPVVQSATTKQVSVANLTAGRTITSSKSAVGGSTIASNVLSVTGTSNFTDSVGIGNTPQAQTPPQTLWIEGDLAITSGNTNIPLSDRGGIHIGMPQAKNVASSGGYGTIKIFSNNSNSPEEYLQGTIALLTNPTAGLRRLRIECIEQGTSYRNITLNDQATTGQGFVGIGLSNPSYILTLRGDTTCTFGMDRHPTLNGVGQDLTIVSGAAAAGATTDKDGGALLLKSGTSRGTGSSYMAFYTAPAGSSGTSDNNPIERMRITSAGYVGIGVTPAGSNVLQVKGAADQNIAITGQISVSNAVTINAINDANTVNIPLDFRASQLYCSTGITGAATGTTMKFNTSTFAITYDTSAARYKDNIRDSVYGLDAVKKLRSAMFEYKADGKTDVGLIAEEVREIIPELVGLNTNGEVESVSYDRMVSVLIKAVQELAAKIEAA